MADDRRRRFLQIERPRGPGAPDPAPPGGGVEGRFGAPDQRAAPSPTPVPAPPSPPARPVPAGHVERFRPAAEAPLEVADRGAGHQPFVRCCGCETDNTLYAVRCSTCGSELHTDEQRAFNERLWEERRALSDAESAAVAARSAGLEAAAAEAAQARRAGAEALAREVGDAERRRLEPGGGSGEPAWGPGAGGGGGGWGDTGRPGTGWGSTDLGGGLSGGQPFALRLLSAIPDPRWRVAAGVAAIAVPALLYLVAPKAGLVIGLLVLGLFMPGGWRRRRRWW